MVKWTTSALSSIFIGVLLYNSPKTEERDEIIKKWKKRDVLSVKSIGGVIYKTKFSIDLRKWKYLLKMTSIQAQNIEMYNNGKVSLEILSNSRRGSSWFPEDGKIELNLPPIDEFLEKLMKYEKYEDADSFLEDTWLDMLRVLKHEATHMTQTFMEIGMTGSQDLEYMERRPGPGLPSRKIMNPSITQNSLSLYDPQKLRELETLGVEDKLHELDGVEFYTRLSDEVTIFRKKYRNLSREERKEKALYWIGEMKSTDEESVSPWMKFLRKKSPLKWRKAVKEFLKKVF